MFGCGRVAADFWCSDSLSRGREMAPRKASAVVLIEGEMSRIFLLVFAVAFWTKYALRKFFPLGG